MDAEKNIRIAAADLLLGRGVRFKMAGAPFLWRIFRFNRITVRSLKLGAIIEISRVVVQAKLDEDATRQHLMDNMDKICLCVSIAMLNNRKRIRIFSRRLAQLLLWKLPASTLLNVFYYIAGDYNKSLEVRRKAVEKLNRIMPDYNGYIDKEGNFISNSTEALKKHIEMLYKVEKAKKLLEGINTKPISGQDKG